ncbi:MAG: hypothetical protein AAB727_02200 [Patescibacteria group bacterium]
MDENEGRLGRLKKALYERGIPPRLRRRQALPRHEPQSPETWQHEAPRAAEPAHMKKKMSLGMKFFLGSLIFFIVAVAIVIIVFSGGGNIVSTKNVSIMVTGPVAVPAGEEVSLDVAIENNNTVSLESAELLIEYPSGTRDSRNLEKDLTRSRKSLGTIEPGTIFKEPIRLVFFGQEGDAKDLHLTLEYRTRDSNAIFANEKVYSTHISSSATSLTTDVPSEVIAGQAIEIRITLSSNAQTVTENILTHIEYPFGFSYIGAAPDPSYDNDTWVLGDIAPGGKRTIVIRGVVEGQDGEQKVFRVSSGTPGSKSPEEIGVSYNSSVAETKIARPFLSTVFFIDGEALPEYVIDPEVRKNVDIAWVNNLPTKIINAQIEVKLAGDTLDVSSIDPKNGFFRSSDKVIIWDQGSDENLREIEPGEQGKVSFRFKTKSLFTGVRSLFEEPIITVSVTAGGNRVSGEGVPERIENTIKRVLKVNSAVVFTPRAVFGTGPFVNRGALPPVVEKETTYTIIWTVLNSSNGISRASARAVLPPYVSWLGTVSPQTETMSYNETTREVLWNIGRIAPGAGITKAPREVAFQVSFLPSLSHMGQTPTIVGESLFSGADDFTGVSVERTGKTLNTILNTDPTFIFNQGQVIQKENNGQ